MKSFFRQSKKGLILFLLFLLVAIITISQIGEKQRATKKTRAKLKPIETTREPTEENLPISQWVPVPIEEYKKNLESVINFAKSEKLELEPERKKIIGKAKLEEKERRLLERYDSLNNSSKILERVLDKSDKEEYIDSNGDGKIDYQEFNNKTAKISQAVYEVRHTLYDGGNTNLMASGLVNVGDLTNPTTKNNKVYVFVEGGIYEEILPYLKQYEWDVESCEDYDLKFWLCNDCSHEQIRNELKNGYNNNNVAGTVFIGDLPSVWYYTKCGEHDTFPIDLYFMDIDGNWKDEYRGCDKSLECTYIQNPSPEECAKHGCYFWTWGEGLCDNPDDCGYTNKTECESKSFCRWREPGGGIYDDHSGNKEPEIFLGRLTSPSEIDEIQLIKHYFEKNHNYRSGIFYTRESGFQKRGFYYIDEAGSGPEENYWLSLLYGNNFDGVYNNAVEDPGDYKAPFTDVENYMSFFDKKSELLHITAHSTPWAHGFEKKGEWETITSSYIRDKTPNFLFYTLFACSNARYSEPNYMAGWYVFQKRNIDTGIESNFGLVAFGGTKSFGSLYTEYYYDQLNNNDFGTSYKNWFRNYGYLSQCYGYGRTLIGDPTLKVNLDCKPPILDTDSDGISDFFDNCPNNSNPDQKDSDDNGIGDKCEKDWSDKSCSSISDFKDIYNRYDWGQDGADTRFGTDFDYESGPQEDDGDDGVTLNDVSLENNTFVRGKSYTLKVVSNNNYDPPKSTAKGWVDWDGVGGNPPELIMDYSYPHVMFDNTSMPVKITVPDYAKDQVCLRFINKYYTTNVSGYNDNTHSGEAEDYVVNVISCKADVSILNEKCEPSGEDYKISWSVKGYADKIETWLGEEEHQWCQNPNQINTPGGNLTFCDQSRQVTNKGNYQIPAKSYDDIEGRLYQCGLQQKKVVTCNPCITNEGVFCTSHDNKFTITGSFSWSRFQQGSDHARVIVKDKDNNLIYESTNDYSSALTFWYDVNTADSYNVKATVYNKDDQELCFEGQYIECIR